MHVQESKTMILKDFYSIQKSAPSHYRLTTSKEATLPQDRVDKGNKQPRANVTKSKTPLFASPEVFHMQMVTRKYYYN